MTPAALRRAVAVGVLAGLAVLLGACSEHAAKPPASAVGTARNGEGRELAMARGRVEVEGGLLEVMATQEGVVEAVAVKEGDAVRRGQLLLKLAPDAVRIDVAIAQAELRLVQARAAAQAARLPAARLLAQRTAEAARLEALDPQRADEAIKEQREIESALAVLRAEAGVAQKRLDQSMLLLQRQTWLSPVDASVLKLNVQPGSRIAAQATRAVMVLLPQRPLVVRAELNESFLARVKPGTRAAIQLDGDGGGSVGDQAAEAGGIAGAQRLAATVLRLAPSYSSSRLDDDAPARANLRVVDCFLAVEPAPNRLRLGQEVRVIFHE